MIDPRCDPDVSAIFMFITEQFKREYPSLPGQAEASLVLADKLYEYADSLMEVATVLILTEGGNMNGN